MKETPEMVRVAPDSLFSVGTYILKPPVVSKQREDNDDCSLDPH